MAEEKVETELGPESKGLLAKLADKLQEGKDATEELGTPLAATLTAVDMSAMTIAAATKTGLSAVTGSLSMGFDLMKNDNLTTIGAIKGLGSVMSDGLGAVGGKLGSMLNADLRMLKLRERADKLAKSGGDLLKSGITTAAKKVGGIAKGILDILLEGAFLLALWGLMKWLEGPGFKWVMMIFDYVVKVGDWISLLFTDPTAALTQLWNGITNGAASIGNWIWDNVFVAFWDWFEGKFPGTASVISKLWDGVVKLTGNLGNWIWETAIKPVWEWLKLLFTDPKAALIQLFDGVMSLGDWLWNSAILPLWNWYKLLFNDPKAAFVELFAGGLSMGKWLWDTAVKPLWDWFETTFPDAAAFIKETWATFMATGPGQWLYSKVLEPFSKWLDLAFVDPTAALDEAWTFFESMGTWVFDTVLQPLWLWVRKLFTDPTTALDESFTFFTSIGSWIFTNALEPFWKWFKGLFPDVAKSLETFWTTLTAPEGEYVEEPGIMGVIMGLLRGAWQWLEGLFDFTSMEGLVSTALNLFFLPANLIIDMMGKAWDMIKGFFGFTKDEAKLPEDFSIGKFITDTIGKIWGWVRNLMGFGDDVAANEKKMEGMGLGEDALGNFIKMIGEWFSKLFDIDIAALGKSILGDSLYAFLFGDEEAEILAKQRAIEMHKKEMSEGDQRDWKGTKREDLIRVLEEEIADLNTEMLSKKNASGQGKLASSLEMPGGGAGGTATIINNNNITTDASVKQSSSLSSGQSGTKPAGKLVVK